MMTLEVLLQVIETHYRQDAEVVWPAISSTTRCCGHNNVPTNELKDDVEQL